MTDAAVLAWDETGTIRGAAGACARVLGKGASELRGRRIASLLERPDALDDARRFGLTRSVRLAGGELVRVEAGPVDGGAVAVVRGGRPEEESLARLVSSLGHELRNAFASVLLAVQSLRRHEPDMSERGRRRLEVADRELRRIDAVLRGLRELGRVQVSRPVSAIPERLAREALASLAAEIAAEQVGVDAPAADGPSELLDPPRVRLALEEMLRSAVRDSPAGARVIVTVQRSARELVFELLTPARPEPGHAGEPRLGLAVVEGVARAHGGHVEHSRTADGERLCLVLPRSPART